MMAARRPAVAAALSSRDTMSEQQTGDTSLEARVIKALRSVYDPEIPVNIYELGLIYKLAVGEDGAVAIDMTLTTPNCPVADVLPTQVKQRVEAVEGVTRADVKLVWDPPWTKERMSERAMLELGMAGFPTDDANKLRVLGQGPKWKP